MSRLSPSLYTALCLALSLSHLRVLEAPLLGNLSGIFSRDSQILLHLLQQPGCVSICALVPAAASVFVLLY
jgi:hypothetical protein